MALCDVIHFEVMCPQKIITNNSVPMIFTEPFTPFLAHYLGFPAHNSENHATKSLNKFP